MTDPNSLSENMGIDMDTIVSDARKAKTALENDDYDRAENLVDRIISISRCWEDPK